MTKDKAYLERRSVVNAKTGCLEFVGAYDTGGYGNVNIDGKTWKAHRYSWFLEHGPIADGLCVCHKCDNPKCINTAHLFLGTKRENGDDMYRKGRGIKAHGSDHHHAKLLPEEVVRIREAYLFGARQVDLAAAFNTNQTNISQIVRRKAWRNVA